MKTTLDIIQNLIARGALFVVNDSAGKDSQAMKLLVRKLVPADQILIVHADLGEVEWAGNLEHIARYSDGLPVVVAKPARGLLQMIEERGMFPSPSNRQCTSDLKRGPIEREIRRHLKANPRFNGLVVNCIGLRADESSSRAKEVPFQYDAKNSKAGREWYRWLPIHAWTEAQVRAVVAGAGQELHPVYAQGMTRLSCCFCIMASSRDLTTAARLNPTLYKRYVELEKRIGHTMNMQGRGLEQVTGVAA